MKFCDKLVKQRKNNNISQEQLADRLGVSRQAVSKWESGLSMPDMEKIMQLCKILNCSLEDLIDDDACGNNKKAKEKVSSHIYLQEGLDFITKTLNMFWSMRLTEKIKCILEMIFVIIIMFLIWSIVGSIIYNIFSGIIYMLPSTLYHIIYNLSSIIYSIFGIIVGVILFVHIFKIRYLDYFITIEDDNSKDKKIEEPVDEEKKEERKFIEKKKNKIIIRDPKHSTYNFFKVLSNFVIWILKFILLLVAIPCIICFIFLAFGTTFSIWLLKDGIIFLGITIILLGCILINFIILKLIYNFISNQKNNLKLIFRLFILGIVLSGIGFGISFCTYLTFDKANNLDNINYTTKEFTIDPIDATTIVEFIDCSNVEIVEDNSINNIKIEFTYNENSTVNLYDYNDYNEERIYHVYDYYYEGEDDIIDIINILIDLLKSKTRIDDYDKISVSEIKVTISSANLSQIRDNNESRYY